MDFTKIKNFRFTKLFSSEDSRFVVLTASKVAGVYLSSMLLVSYLMWVVLSMNNVFFEAHGFPELNEFRSAYFDYILANTFENLSYILAFYIILFLLGLYTGRILIRPFDKISDASTLAFIDGTITATIRTYASEAMLKSMPMFSFLEYSDRNYDDGFAQLIVQEMEEQLPQQEVLFGGRIEGFV